MKKNDFIQSKIFNFNNSDDRTKITHLISFLRFKEQKIIFTNGCFDIMHLGHIDYLSKAADLGNHLIIGLNSDTSIKKIKGNNRPILPEQTRAAIIASLFFVQTVILFDNETPFELINFIQPNVLVKGSDYKPDEIVGNDIVSKNGGEIVTIDFLDGHSTTSIIHKIKTS